MLRKQRRFDRKNVIARDVPGRVDAFENKLQRGRIAFGDIRHAESSARLRPVSNPKFESVMLLRFQKLIDVRGPESRRRYNTESSSVIMAFRIGIWIVIDPA